MNEGTNRQMKEETNEGMVEWMNEVTQMRLKWVNEITQMKLKDLSGETGRFKNHIM